MQIIKPDSLLLSNPTPPTATPLQPPHVASEVELGLIAWAKLNFAQKSSEAIELYMLKKAPRLCELSIVDEHRFKQEARKRGVVLPR